MLSLDGLRYLRHKIDLLLSYRYFHLLLKGKQCVLINLDTASLHRRERVKTGQRHATVRLNQPVVLAHHLEHGFVQAHARIHVSASVPYQLLQRYFPHAGLIDRGVEGVSVSGHFRYVVLNQNILTLANHVLVKDSGQHEGVAADLETNTGLLKQVVVIVLDILPYNTRLRVAE